MWFIRGILKVSWKDKKTNDEVLDMANTGRSLYSTIRRKQMMFTGHIYRARGIEHLAMTGKIHGKKSLAVVVVVAVLVVVVVLVEQ
ncbi:hypothetical protein ElyMa_000458100 [Elysia marginata]|uniref:Uncharacterized protein n=1 Tax=Elysia marginata TaxID=1093978 RepID=A0AAV4FQT6_9GAST|nr:hypothetical protein ElyMa_000458100 [Elysia marginata]